MLHKLTADNIEGLLGFSLVVFWQPGCEPCKAAKEIAKYFASTGRIVYMCNAKEEHALKKRYNITVTPTVLLLEDTVESGRVEGAQGSLEPYMEMLEESVTHEQEKNS